MIAPHCIKPASITITASIAACIGCLCAATVPSERRSPGLQAHEAAAVPDFRSPAARLNETPRMRTVSADRGDEHDDRDDGGRGCGRPGPRRADVAATQA